jgi:hypothetical protein
MSFSGQLMVDSGQWTVDSGQWTVEISGGVCGLAIAIARTVDSVKSQLNS